MLGSFSTNIICMLVSVAQFSRFHSCDNFDEEEEEEETKKVNINFTRTCRWRKGGKIIAANYCKCRKDQ